MEKLPIEIVELVYSLLDGPNKVCFRLCCRLYFEILPRYVFTRSEAIDSGILSLIKFINPKKTSLLFNRMIRHGYLEVLKWLKSENCSWNWETYNLAAYNGHLEVLKWLKDEGCEWDNATSSAAARGGRLEVLKWLRSEGCRWGAATCHAAADGGHLEVLKWLRSADCPWDERTCSASATDEHFEILRWAASGIGEHVKWQLGVDILKFCSG